MSIIASRRMHKGFTLIELMIAILMVAALAILATPSMSKTILKHRAQDAATDIFSAMFKARSEALKRNANISLRPAAGGWASGWTIPDPINAGQFLEEHLPLSRVTVAFSGLTSAPSFPVYNASGRIANGTPQWVVTASSSSYTCTYTVRVDPSGRPYETTTGAAGTKTAGGGAPAC